PVDPRKKVPGRPGTGRTVALPEDCQVLIRDRCPAYITWEQHQANRRQMAENRDRAKARGPMREGAALLSGLVVCGRCGHRMTVHYTSRCEPRYACIRDVVDYGGPRCQSLAGKPLEQLLAQQVLTVLEPAALELSLQAAAAIEQDRASVDRHWRLRLERAGHDVDRAARQYHRVEPENRLVARELEAQWERELQAQQALQEQYERHRRQQAPDLSDAQRQEIRDLSRDIPTLWRSSRTTVGDRQAIVRLLVERITVGAPQDSNHADVTIHWAGGFASQHRMRRPVARYEQLDDYAQLSQRVLELHDQQRTAPQIAEQLNREGFRPPKRRDTYNGGMVGTLIRRMRPVTPSLRPAAALNADEWYLNDLADHLSMRPHTLYRWMCRGWVHARKHPANGRWVLWADPDELDRLRRLKTAPRTWHNQLQAAHLTQPKARPDGSEKAGCPGGFASAGGTGDSANP
ncbi:MAG TPA: zinc ribbon domain-containing protein, partial [Pseudomonadales bacterium]